MSKFLTKLQKQEMGSAIRFAGSIPTDFLCIEDSNNDSQSCVKLTHRQSSDIFIATQRPTGHWVVEGNIPGTPKMTQSQPTDWANVVEQLQRWAREVKRESEAVDPWEVEAEDMADDDSLFSLGELPKVDRAIDEALAELQRLAVEAGVQQGKVAAELRDVKELLKKNARSATKKEWVTMFKAIVIEKLLEWGLQTELSRQILQVLITSAHDIAQLASHATRHISG